MKKLTVSTLAVVFVALVFSHTQATYVAQLNQGTISKSSAYTVTQSDNGKTVECDAAGGAFTVTLSAAALLGNGFQITFLKVNADTATATNAVTIDANASETINGALDNRLQGQFSFVSLVCDGSNWKVVKANDWLVLKDGAGQSIANGASGDATYVNFTNCQLSVPSGEWDVTGIVVFGVGTSAADASGNWVGAVSEFSGNTTTDHVAGDNLVYALPASASSNSSSTIAAWRVVKTSTSTVYLKAQVTISSGTANIFGRISARRVR